MCYHHYGYEHAIPYKYIKYRKEIRLAEGCKDFKGKRKCSNEFFVLGWYKDCQVTEDDWPSAG